MAPKYELAVKMPAGAIPDANDRLALATLSAQQVCGACTPATPHAHTVGLVLFTERYWHARSTRDDRLVWRACGYTRIHLAILRDTQAFKLHEETVREGGRRLGEFPFTPLVRVSYFSGLQQRAAFDQPLELTMPHCFDPEEGSESLVMLGDAIAAHAVSCMFILFGDADST